MITNDPKSQPTSVLSTLVIGDDPDLGVRADISLSTPGIANDPRSEPTSALSTLVIGNDPEHTSIPESSTERSGCSELARLADPAMEPVL